MAAPPREMANAVRFLALDAIVHAGDGHPGTPRGAADICTALFTRHLFLTIVAGLACFALLGMLA